MPSQYAIHVHDLIRRPGESRPFDLTVTAPEALGNAVIGVPEGGELRIAGRLESLHDGLLVTAEVDATAAGECVRCLVPITEPVEVEFQELFGYDGTSDFGGSDPAEPEYLVRGDVLDLEQVVRDTLVPALPFQPVCQEDCEGLCPVCGVRLLDEPGHEHEAPVDPRWSTLQALTEDKTSE